MFEYGELAEWSKAAVLKTVDGKPSGGSNPSLSANSSIKTIIYRLSKTLDTVSVEPWEQQQGQCLSLGVLLSSRAFSSELDTIFATLAAASLRVRPEVVDGDFSAAIRNWALLFATAYSIRRSWVMGMRSSTHVALAIQF